MKQNITNGQKKVILSCNHDFDGGTKIRYACKKCGWHFLPILEVYMDILKINLTIK